MPDTTGSTHLQLSDLGGGDVVRVLEDYGAWTASLDEDFKPITDAVRRCVHKDREPRVRLVLDVLGYTSELFATQTLRIEKRTWVDVGTPSADLVPVRIKKIVGDEAAAGSATTVGECGGLAGSKTSLGHDQATGGKLVAAGGGEVIADNKNPAGSDQSTTPYSEIVLGKRARLGSHQAVPGTVYNESINPVRLAVGQKLHVTRPLIVDPGMEFILIQRRGPADGP